MPRRQPGLETHLNIARAAAPKNELRRELEKAFEKQRQEELNRQRDRLAGMAMIYNPLGRGY
jgi:hypothetical protein